MRKVFRIGEISRLYHIGVDSLRYYEELGLIHPRRSEGGYRLYNIGDIWRLNVIRELRELGLPMDQIRQYLQRHTVDATLEMLRHEQTILRERIERLEKTQESVASRMETLHRARERQMEHIAEETYPPRRFFAIHEGYADEHEMDLLIKRLMNMDENFYVIGNNQIGTVISRAAAEKTGDLRYEDVFLLDDNGPDAFPGGTYLTVSYRGDYAQSGRWALRLLEYARANGWTPEGDLLEIVWVDIHTTEKVDEYITELQLRVKK